MKAALIRTGSGSFPLHSLSIPTSPRFCPFGHDSVSGTFSGEKFSPRISLSIRRAMSEPNMIHSTATEVPDGSSKLTRVRSQSFPAVIPEEDDVSDGDEVLLGGIGSLMMADRSNYAGECPGSGIPVEELGFSGGGIGKGRMSGGGSSGNDFGITGGNADRSNIGAYYEKMLKSDPMNYLLLRNYGKFLHEIEGDTVKAEECYGRAILSSPGDGEVLSLYGKLIWDTQRDKDRAKSYFDQAVLASPNDCMVLGSYAQFMWETEEDEDEDRETGASPAMVEAV